jgi:NAD(P)-dependent dehydrogenase (short-subunit alcohol dehydrogenase family)
MEVEPFGRRKVILEENIKNMFSLNGKVAIVTGASRGIGATVSDGMAIMGAKVYGIVRSINKSNKLRHSIKKKCDITRTEDFRKLCHSIYKENGRIDILVNNAGITCAKGKTGLYPLSKWNKTIETNLTAQFLCSQIVFKYMKKMGGGSIINITSISSELGFPGNPAYAASKGGLKILGKALASEWAHYGIRVNNVGPGYIMTDMTQQSYRNEITRAQRKDCMMIKRWGSPEDIIGACVFLASDASNYITGQDIYVDGGWVANGFLNPE